MGVFLTPPDRDGCRWRIEARRDGLVRVFQMAGDSVAAAFLRRPTTIAELGPWLLERGIDPDQLEEM